MNCIPILTPFQIPAPTTEVIIFELTSNNNDHNIENIEDFEDNLEISKRQHSNGIIEIISIAIFMMIAIACFCVDFTIMNIKKPIYCQDNMRSV